MSQKIKPSVTKKKNKRLLKERTALSKESKKSESKMHGKN